MQTINGRQGTKQSWDPGVDLDVRQTEEGSYSRHAALFPHLGDKTHPPRIDPLPLVQIANDLPLASHPIMYPVSQHQLLRQIAAPAEVRGGYAGSLSLDSFLNPSSPSCLFSPPHIGPFQFQV